MSTYRGLPACVGRLVEGECDGCLFVRECRYARWLREECGVRRVEDVCRRTDSEGGRP